MHVVVVSLVAAGTVEEFDATRKATIAAKAAAEAGVASDAVTVAIEPASVRITITIQTSGVDHSSAVSSALTSKLSSPEIASAALGIPNVESVAPVVQKVITAEARDDASSSGSMVLVIGVSIAVVAAIGVAAFVLRLKGFTVPVFQASTGIAKNDDFQVAVPSQSSACPESASA